VTQVLKNITARLTGYEGENTLFVSLIPFYQDAFAASPAVRIRITGKRASVCPARAESEIVRLSKSYADAEEAKRAAQCSAMETKERKDRAIDSAAEIEKLNRAIDMLAIANLAGN
jgi:hypothetical protein